MSNAPNTPHNLMPITVRPAAIMVRGEGSYLWDADGNRYLDFVQGWAVNTLGHCPEVIHRALCQQAGTLIHAGAAFHNAPQLALATALCEGSALHEVFFCNSGAEANEGAVKLARKWGQLHRRGAHRVITTTASFHGRTLAMMAASGKEGFPSRFPPAVPGFTHAVFGDIESARALIDDSAVAIMVEPIQGEAGVIEAPPGYLQALRELTQEHGMLLILDEVQTGMGRTGTRYCHEQHGVQPDIMTLGKGLGGGVPLAALLCQHHVSCFEPGDQGGTFNGNPLMTAVGLAVHEAIMRSGFLEGVRARGARLRAALGGLPGVVGVRGAGLLCALQMEASRAQAVRDVCHRHGLLVNAAQPNVVRLMPALNVSDDEIDMATDVLGRALLEVCE